ncbi:MAG: hypothetical protein LBD53_00150 [Tannerella sp.]|jgi:hypothetical protein|nr:hypothetical protein [Tannerella sp.]
MRRKYLIISVLFTLLINVAAQDEPWRDEMQYLQYAPRYFGPNAFPMPELRYGYINDRIEAEIRGEHHYYSGDRTKDIFARLFIPVADGIAGVEVSFLAYEYYKMSPQTVAERHAAGTYWEDGAHGDVVVSSFWQLFRSDRWADVMLEASLKTASGNRLADARFTDAAAYWFNINAGRNILKINDLEIRMQGFVGFYCWMTNNMVHRQNDAVVYSAGLSAKYRRLSANLDMAGIFGYEDKGDRPLQFRSKIEYEYKRNALSFRYKHGFKDCLYNTCSIGYIRYF